MGLLKTFLFALCFTTPLAFGQAEENASKDLQGKEFLIQYRENVLPILVPKAEELYDSLLPAACPEKSCIKCSNKIIKSGFSVLTGKLDDMRSATTRLLEQFPSFQSCFKDLDQVVSGLKQTMKEAGAGNTEACQEFFGPEGYSEKLLPFLNAHECVKSKHIDKSEKLPVS